jgi:hypothetical protein
MKSLSKGTRIGKVKKNFTFHSPHKPDNAAKGEEGREKSSSSFFMIFHQKP